jgi:hypothetical protein
MAQKMTNDEYTVRVGIEYDGSHPLVISTTDHSGFPFTGTSTPLRHFIPVDVSVSGNDDPLDYFWRVHDLAQDCVNQGGVSNVQLISPPRDVVA